MSTGLTILRDRDPDAWTFVEGRWIHRPRWKVAINTVLRAVQPWSRKLLVVTKFCMSGPDRSDVRPRALGYGVGLVMHKTPDRSDGMRPSSER